MARYYYKDEIAQKIIRWTIFGMSIVTWIFSIVAVANCTFIRIADDFDNELEYGMFNFYDGTGCAKYDGAIELTGAHKSAQAFGIMAALFMGFTMLLVIAIQLFLAYRVEMFWLAVRILFIVTALCQVLTFSFFGDDLCKDATDVDGVTCTSGAAGGIAAVNVILLVSLCVLVWLVSPPEQPAFKCGGDEDEADAPKSNRKMKPTVVSGAGSKTKETAVHGRDGKKTTTKEVINADGTKTVTTTVEVLNNDGSITKTVTVDEYGSSHAEPDIEIGANSSQGRNQKINVF